MTTNESGAYQIGPLTPGTYELRTTRTGFKTAVRSGVLLQTGATLKLDVQLELGQVTDRIEVSGGGSDASRHRKTSVAEVLVATQQLERIPVNGRNYTRLLVLMPGMSDISPGVQG